MDDDVENDVVAVFKGIGVMEGEEGGGVGSAGDLAGLLVDDVEADAAFRVPFVVANEGAIAEQELERIHDEGELGEDQVAGGHADRMQVGGAINSDGSKDRFTTGGVDREEAVFALKAEVEDVRVVTVAMAVVVGMGGAGGAFYFAGVFAEADGGERLRIEADGETRLSERDEGVVPLSDVDAAVVGEPGGEPRDDSLEQRAAGIGGEFGTADFSCGDRFAVGLALEKTVGVGDAASVDAESVEHRQTVEPVVVGLLSDFEAGGAGANESAGEPRGDRSLDGEAGDVGFGGQGCEAEAVEGLVHRVTAW